MAAAFLSYSWNRRCWPTISGWRSFPHSSHRNHPTKGRMQKLSAFVLAYNEAEKIKAAVETVLWADEIVVVDSHSTDATPRIAESLGARVVQVPFNGFGELRNRAVEACRGEWIFSLD